MTEQNYQGLADARLWRVRRQKLGITFIAIAAMLASIFVGVGDADAEYTASPAAGQWQIDGEIVYAITQIGDRIYAGGDFLGARSPSGTSTPQADLLAFNATTGVFEPGFAPTIVGRVETLASSTDGSVLYVGGKFTSINGVARNGVVALDPATGATITTFIADTQPNSTVYDLIAHNEHVYIAGVYTRVNGTIHRRLARVDSTTGVLDTTWAPTPDSRVDDLAIPPAGDRIYAVGQFKNMNGVYTNSVAALDLITGATVPGFPASTINQSRAVDATDDRVVVNHRQGNFVSVLDASGNLILQNAGDGDFQENELVGRRSMIGSHSRTFGPTSMKRLQALHLSDGTASTTLNTPVQGWPGVFAIYASGSDLWVGGKIWKAGTTFADRIVRIGIDPAQTGPTEPTALTATGLTTGDIELNWTASTDDLGVAGYRILRAGSQVGFVTTGTTWTDVSVVPGINYVYNVEAVDTDDNLSSRTPDVFQVGPVADITPPDAPTAVIVTAANATSVTLSWTAATDDVAVTDYEILRDSVVVGTTGGPTTTFTDTGLTAATTYNYEIRALDGDGNVSPESAPPTAGSTVSDTVAPSTPGVATLTAATGSQLDITWAASTDNVAVTNYEILRDGVVVGTSGGPTTTFTDTGLTAATTYSYEIRALDGSSNVSALSTAAPLSTPDDVAPTAPGAPVIGVTTATTIDLTWPASTDNVAVTSYEVLRDGVVVGTAATEAFTDTGLTPGASYAYTVRALDAATNVSAESVATTGTALADVVDPNGTLTEPTQNQVMSSPVNFFGDATDDIGVDKVEVAIKNLNVGDPDYKLWLQDDLVTWGSYNRVDSTLASPGATATAWDYSLALPDGTFGVSVIATDLAGNDDSARPWVKFDVSSAPPDNVLPDPGVIVNPTANQALTGLSHLFDGTASDDVGVDTVEILIKDIANNVFLRVDGTFGSYQRLPTTLGTPGGAATTWSATYDLPAGNYWVKVFVTDTSGNKSANPPPKTNFTVS